MTTDVTMGDKTCEKPEGSAAPEQAAASDNASNQTCKPKTTRSSQTLCAHI